MSLCGTESDMLFVDSAAAQVSQLRTLTHPTLYTGHRKPSKALLASKNWLWCAGIMSLLQLLLKLIDAVGSSGYQAR